MAEPDTNSSTTTASEDLFRAEDGPRKEQLFTDISAENSFTEMESLCMACRQQGVTRLLLTKIPFFKEIILMAFTCPHCGWRSNEIQSGGVIAERACRVELKVRSKEDLNRQIVKSDTASIRIPELDFERGLLNTIEGFLMQSVEGLKQDQEERRKIDPETTARIDEFIAKLEGLQSGTQEFTLILEDLAGNSFIENPYAPAEDPNMKVSRWVRTPEQNWAIGLTTDESAEEHAAKEAQSTDTLTRQEKKDEDDLGAWREEKREADNRVDHYGLDFEKFDYKRQVMTFPGNCPSCHAPSETRMVAVDIPHFKEVIIMASNCDACGFKSNDVKAGGAIAPKGRRIILKVTKPEDLSRDILKSETAVIHIPEKDITVTRGTLGGRFTTLEGLLTGIKSDLLKADPFRAGDSATEDRKVKFQRILDELDTLISGQEKFTLEMDDPAANSYIQNIYAPDPDPYMTIEDYERTFEENEDLGLNDMKTEDY